MRALPAIRLLFLTLIAFSLVIAPGDAAEPPPFLVIVQEGNPNVVLDRSVLAEAFLKKTTRWPSGDVIKPVDLPPDSPAREHFSREVVKRSVAAVKSYWQQIIFSGRDVPPLEVASDDEVIKYVQTHHGAIGYVSGGAHLAGVKTVSVR
jgi:ABC-type phosphate transport system substrate-binding protein